MLNVLKILPILIIQAAFAQAVWDGTADTDWYNESDTEFTITTAEQLAGFAQLVSNGNNFLDKTVILGQDISLNDTADWENWASNPPVNNWVRIGAPSKNFRGTFDCNGFIISGVYINSSNNSQGLFNYIDSNGTIKNIGVTASYIKGKDFVGGLAGTNCGTIDNSYFIGTVTGMRAVGGLAGQNDYAVSNSYFIGKVEGTGASTNGGNMIGNYVGGLAGDNTHNGTISTSYSIGNVAGHGTTGGLAGSNSGIISNSYSTSEIIALYTYNGAIVITDDQYFGGLVGGDDGTISNSYSIGSVMGASRQGGLVGSTVNNGRYISNSYYDKETSRQSDTGKGEGKTTAQMKQQSTFVDWDFTNVWGIDSKKNCGYPYLLNLEYSKGCNTNTPIIRLPQIANSQIFAQTASNAIVLENLPYNAKIEIYNTQGKRMHSANSENSQILKIPVQAKGLYIVKVNNVSFRMLAI